MRTCYLSAMVVTVLVSLASLVATRARASDIPFRYVELERQRSYSNGTDFDSWGDLKKAVNAFLKDYECPRCRGHQCAGDHLVFDTRKVDIYREVEKQKLFGGTKKADEFVKTVWRVEDAYLRQRDGGLGILSDETEGYLKCTRKDCGWEIKGGIKPKTGGSVQWVRIKDIPAYISGR